MKLDFRTKFLLTISIATIAIMGRSVTKYPLLIFLVYLFPLAFLFSIKKYRYVIKMSLVLAFVILFSRIAQIINIDIISAVSMILLFFTVKLLPGALMGYYAVISTSMSDLLHSLTKMKVPDLIIIPVSVMFRFFYSVNQDYRSINDAMKMHGITFWSFFSHPIRFFEYKLVPLLMCSVRTADDVAISAITRGLVVGKERSSISESKLVFWDYVFIIISIALLAIEIWYIC